MGKGNAQSRCKVYLILHCMSNQDVIRSGPDSAAKIFGERLAERPGGSIEVLIHRCVSLEEWSIKGPGAPTWRMYYPLSEGAEAFHQDRQQLLKANEIYLIPPHSNIRFETHLPFAKWFLHFTLKGDQHELPPGLYLIRKNERIEELIKTCCPSPPFSKESSFQSAPWATIELIAQVLENAYPEFKSAPEFDARLKNAIALMNQSLTQKLTLADLSTETGLKERALNGLFLKHTGLSPIRYWIELRLNEASRLLRHSELSIEEIAEQSGFANRFYLNRMLKKYRNITPAAFRSQV